MNTNQGMIVVLKYINQARNLFSLPPIDSLPNGDWSDIKHTPLSQSLPFAQRVGSIALIMSESEQARRLAQVWDVHCFEHFDCLWVGLPQELIELQWRIDLGLVSVYEPDIRV
jgi:hypothetical protein